jgi:hypothetical protein
MGVFLIHQVSDTILAIPPVVADHTLRNTGVEALGWEKRRA